MTIQPMEENNFQFTCHCDSWAELVRIYKNDLSRGLFFVPTKVSQLDGNAVKVTFFLPSKTKVEFAGTVKEEISNDGKIDGVYISIDDISLENMWIIESAVNACPESATIKIRTGDEATDINIIDRDDIEKIDNAAQALIKALWKELSSIAKVDPFQVLQCEYAASDEDVQSSFSRLAKRYHPDKFVRYHIEEVDYLSEEIFLFIRDAYENLNTEEKRDVEREKLDINFEKLRPALPENLLEESVDFFDDLTDSEVQPSSPAVDEHPGASDVESFLANIELLIDEAKYKKAIRVIERSDYLKTKKQVEILHHLCLAYLALAEKNKLAAAEELELAQDIDPENKRVIDALQNLTRKIVEERQSHLDNLITNIAN